MKPLKKVKTPCKHCGSLYRYNFGRCRCFGKRYKLSKSHKTPPKINIDDDDVIELFSKIDKVNHSILDGKCTGSPIDKQQLYRDCGLLSHLVYRQIISNTCLNWS